MKERVHPIDGEIACLVFDFDGVLVDSDALHWQAYRQAFLAYGIEISLDDYCAHARGRGRSDVVAHFGAHLDACDRARVGEAKGAAARRLLASGTLRPIEGVIAFIDSARARGLRCAVASTSELAALAVDALGIADRFACVCAKQADERPKPFPDVFTRAFRTLECAAGQCLVIEDTAVGARAARAAGAPVVFRETDAASIRDLAPGDAVGFFRTYEELHADLGWGPMGGPQR